MKGMVARIAVGIVLAAVPIACGTSNGDGVAAGGTATGGGGAPAGGVSPSGGAPAGGGVVSNGGMRAAGGIGAPGGMPSASGMGPIAGATDATGGTTAGVGGAVGTAGVAQSGGTGGAEPRSLSYPIGLSDVYILKRQTLGAVTFAGDVGADGVEIDMGPLREAETFEENKLLDPAQAQQFLELASEVGVQFSSIGMVGFLAQDITVKTTFLTKMIPDAIRTMNNLGVKVAYLPTRGTNLKQNPHKKPALVEQLKRAGEQAVVAGVIFGIETTLTAEEEAALIDEIGSPGIRTYFNFKNPLEEGRDLVQELKVFGRDRIVQIHCTDEDGELLRDNSDIDMAAVRDALQEMGWDGWLVMERSRVSGMENRDSFSDNANYLRSFFP